MKKGCMMCIFIVALATACGTIYENPLIENLKEIFISDVLTETYPSSAILRFTTNVPTIAYVRYGTQSGNYTMITEKETNSATTHSFMLVGLTTDTTYYAKVYVESEFTTTTIESAEFSFTTSSTITVSNLTFTPSDLSSGTVTWETNVETTHSLEYGLSSGNYTYSTVPTTTATKNHSIALSGLSTNTTYYYRVRNYHPTLGNTISAEQQFTITEAAPTRSQKQRGIWLVGGLSGASISTAISQIDLYDPVTDTWYPNIASGASGTFTPVSFASVAATNGKIYVIGGFKSDGTVSNLVQIYDVATNSWSLGSSTGFTARANIGSFLYNNKIYILAGTTGNATNAWVSSAGNQVYDIASDTWSAPGGVVPSSSERYGVVLEGVCYFMGGRTAAATVTNAHDGYIVATNQLTTGFTEVVLASARTGNAVALYQRQGYPAMIITIGGFSAITGTTGNYVFQGTTTTTPLNYAGYILYPFVAPVGWNSFTNQYPLALGFAAAIVYNDYLFVFGGATSHSSGGSSAAYKIDLTGLPGSSWNAVQAMPVARFGHGAVKAY